MVTLSAAGSDDEGTARWAAGSDAWALHGSTAAAVGTANGSRPCCTTSGDLLPHAAQKHNHAPVAYTSAPLPSLFMRQMVQ